MRILWFTWKDIEHPLAGGAEVVNDQLAKRLVADGHEVTMIVGGFESAQPEKIINGYKVIRLGNRYSLYFLAYKYYKKHLRGWADLVIEEVNTLPFFTKMYVDEPIVLFFHQLCREIWFYQMPTPISQIGYVVEPLYLRFLGAKTPIITVSESAKADLQKHGFKNISIISEGITIEPAETIKNIPKYSKPTILSFGSLRDMKRTLHHIEAFDMSKTVRPDLQLIVAGTSEGSYGKKVLKRIAQSPFRANIKYLENPTEEQKIELFQKSHVLVMTSVKEGWGLVVTEAASQGTPAVVYDVDGLRDSVKNGETGIITAANPQALADGTTKMLSDPKKYNDFRISAWRYSKQINFKKSYQDFCQSLNFTRYAKPTVLQHEGSEE